MNLRPSYSPTSVAAHLATWGRDETGAVSVFYILAFPLLIAGLAFATETGYWMSEQRRVQNVTDAAALSVGIKAARQGFDCYELRDDNDAWDALEATARRIADESGLPPDRTSVTVACPQENLVSVEIDRSIPLFLLSAFDRGNGSGVGPDLSISPDARAIVELISSDDAGGTGNGDGGPDLVCLHALTSEGRGLRVRDETEIEAPECRIQVDSGSNNSIDLGNEAEVEAACITTRGRARERKDVELDLGPSGSECEDIRERTDTDPLPPRLVNLPALEGLGALPNDGLGNWQSFGRNVEISTTRQHPGTNLAVRRFQNLTLGEGWSRWGRRYTFAPGLYVIENRLEINDGVRVTLEDGAAFVLLDGASIDIHQEARVNLGTGLGTGQCDPEPCPWAGLVLFSMGRNGSNGWQDFQVDHLNGVVFLPGYSLRTARWDDGSLGNGCFAILADRFDLRQETEIEITCDEQDRLRLCRQLGFDDCGDSTGNTDNDTGVALVQ